MITIYNRSITERRPIVTDDGKVIEGDLSPIIRPGTDVQVRPQDEDGKPIPGANVTLVCGTPPRSYTGNEQEDGTYILENAVPQSGQEDCTLTVEANG